MRSKHSRPNEESVRAAYEAVNTHWSHAEMERWQILYNFLTANSIIILAWSAIYSSSVRIRTPVLLTLSIGGIVFSILWLIIERRANKFVKQYGELGEKVEKQLHLQAFGLFHGGEKIRMDEHFGTFIPSRHFVL